VARDIEASQEPVLEAHARYGLGADAAEFIAPTANEGRRLIDSREIGHSLCPARVKLACHDAAALPA
jgi:hypothetical protein